jgi:hypothetical protein
MEVNNTRLEYLNPVDVLKSLDRTLPEHTTVNPLLSKLNGAQYEIIRSSTHDGTLIFEKELLLAVLFPVIYKLSFWIHEKIAEKYEIGLIRLETTYYDIVDLPCGKFPGEKQLATMPVKCKE